MVTTSTNQEAPMPNVVAGFEDSKYQQYDHEIAANTALFNDKLETGTNLPKPDNNHSIDKSVLPEKLDVNIVKAMVLQESLAGTISGATGTGKTDIMQSNVKGDWSDTKANIGLSKGETMTPNKSISAGISILFMKGMSSDSGGQMQWRNGSNGNWWDAVKRYNGGGVENYDGQVKSKYTPD